MIGRKREIERLQQALDSKENQLVALWGRRRVGKTFLIRHFYASKVDLFFQVSGKKKVSKQDQFNIFYQFA